MSDKEIILKTIDQDIMLSQGWALYWQAMAVSGAVKSKKIYHGTEGPEFTDDEKVEDAMATSTVHLIKMFELINKKKELLVEG